MLTYPDRWKGDLNVLIDVGTGDNFYKQGQLLPENFEKAVQEAGIKGVEVRYQPVSYPYNTYACAYAYGIHRHLQTHSLRGQPPTLP